LFVSSNRLADDSGTVLVWAVENQMIKTTVLCGKTINDLCW
jgi:hypothetical protein